VDALTAVASYALNPSKPVDLDFADLRGALTRLEAAKRRRVRSEG